jgi:cellulose synthase/poly-beta-1,6-N-acetylglucosamine synthase-like glycosyltransferase
MEQAGPWSEWCICEDAEMGLRLLASGWQSVYVNHCFGQGLVPDHFAGYKIQRFRWVYGAMQILKGHWRWWLPGSPLTPGQRYHFVSGWLPWISDAVGFVLSVLGIVWIGGIALAPHYFSLPIAQLMVPVIIVFALRYGQYLLANKLKTGNRWRDCIGAGFAGLSLNYTIARAVISAVFNQKRPFLRTPKGMVKGRFIRTLTMAREETFLAILLIAAGIISLGIDAGRDPSSGIWAVIFFIQAFALLSAPAMVAVDLISGSGHTERKERV